MPPSYVTNRISKAPFADNHSMKGYRIYSVTIYVIILWRKYSIITNLGHSINQT